MDEMTQAAFSGVVGPDHVRDGEAAAGFTVDGLRPRWVVSPGSAEDVAAVLALADREGLAVIPWGGGTGQGLGNTPQRYDVALSLTRLNRVLDYQPADLTVTVEAGIPLARLQAHLAEHGQFLPLDPPLAERATIGGILARGVTGPRRLRYGGPRDLLLGLRVAHPDGSLSRAGGKVVKNVAGYDLNKLYTASLGTLGVIVEATFKVLPTPASAGTAVAVFTSLEGAAAAARSVLASAVRPLSLDLLNPAAGQRLADQSGFSLPAPGYAVVVQYGGLQAAVGRQLLDFRDLMRDNEDCQEITLDMAPPDAAHRALCNLGGDEGTTPVLLLRALVLPSAVPEVMRRWEQQAGTLNASPLIWAHVGVSIVHSLWRPTGDSSPTDTAALVAALGEAVVSSGGTMVVTAAAPEIKALVDVWGPLPASFPLMQRIKAEFDPKGTLNPGRFVGRL